LQSDGSLVLAGAFSQVNGVARVRIARLFADGTLDPGIRSRRGCRPTTCTRCSPRSDGTIFLGGLFDQYQGAPSNAVVAVATMPGGDRRFCARPSSIIVATGGTARFVAEASGDRRASRISGTKTGSRSGGADGCDAGDSERERGEPRPLHTLQVTASNGSAVTSADATLTVVNTLASQIVNLSVLTAIDAPGATFTLGFVVGRRRHERVETAAPARGGSGAQDLVGSAIRSRIRKLQFYAATTLAGENDDWGTNRAVLSALITQVGAFPYTDPTSKDAGVHPTSIIRLRRIPSSSPA